MRNYSARQKKTKVKIEGVKKITKRLEKMGEGAKDILINAVREGGEIALKEAKDKCPVDTGRLKESIKMQDNKITETKADVKIDYDRKIKYGAFVELGAKGRPANPFMRKAVDENIQKINDRITEKIQKAVVKRW